MKRLVLITNAKDDRTMLGRDFKCTLPQPHARIISELPAGRLLRLHDTLDEGSGEEKADALINLGIRLAAIAVMRCSMHGFVGTRLQLINNSVMDFMFSRPVSLSRWGAGKDNRRAGMVNLNAPVNISMNQDGTRFISG
jgi:hypothetical protein